MGTVYEALNTSIGKRVAMKFVDAEMARNVDAVARFQREAQAASAVESAHIVEIFDSGFTDDGVPYIVMELLRGEDLATASSAAGGSRSRGPPRDGANSEGPAPSPRGRHHPPRSQAR